MEDSSGKARSTSRQSFPFLLSHFPTQTEKCVMLVRVAVVLQRGDCCPGVDVHRMFARLDPRTQKLLEKEGLLVPAELHTLGPASAISSPSGDVPFFGATTRSLGEERDSASVVSAASSTQHRAGPVTAASAKTPVKQPQSATTSPPTAKSVSQRVPLSAPRSAARHADHDAHAGDASWLSVGARVIVVRNGRKPGTVRFVGQTDFGGAGGVWVGVELDDPVGNNAGTVDVRAVVVIPSVSVIAVMCVAVHARCRAGNTLCVRRHMVCL